MPSANDLFINDPIDFLVNNSAINFRPESHIWGKMKEDDSAKTGAGINLSSIDDGDGKIRFDLASIGSNMYVWRRLLTVKQSGKFLTKIGFLPEHPEHPIEANYFPYKSGGVTDISDMGQIEIDSESLPTLSFTGVMNGCAFVVTDANPHVNNKYMLYHYQSPGSNPLYSPSGTNNFPNTMRCYVTDADYIPAPWAAQYINGTTPSLPATTIFMWRNQKTAELRVIAQTVAITSSTGEANHSSRLVQSWKVQSNSTTDPAIAAYTHSDHQVHRTPL